MKKIIELKKESVFLFMNSINYGENLVRYENEYCRNSVLKNIEILNYILGKDAIEEKPYIHTNIENGEYVSKPIDSVFNVSYKLRTIPVPVLRLDDYLVFKNLDKALRDKSIVELFIDERIVGFADKIAKNSGIKLIKRSGNYFFNGLQKEQSISRQIQSAYEACKDSISFNVREVNSATVRCYSSNLGANYGKKFRCEISCGKITVHFAERSHEDILNGKLKKLHDEYNNLIGNVGFWRVFDNYKSEKVEYSQSIDYSEIAKDFYDINKNEADELPQPLIRNAEGLQQYYIAEFEEESVRVDDGNGEQNFNEEDDDF